MLNNKVEIVDEDGGGYNDDANVYTIAIRYQDLPNVKKSCVWTPRSRLSETLSTMQKKIIFFVYEC